MQKGCQKMAKGAILIILHNDKWMPFTPQRFTAAFALHENGMST